MDGITQAALGAWIGELMMGKRLGRQSLAWGALFGIMPGVLEWMVSPLLDTARELACGNALAHSLPLMTLGSWGIANGLAKLWRREKITRTEAGRFVFAVWAAHVALDCLSTTGAAPAWPIEAKRMAFHLIPQPDFLFSAPLVVSAVWLAFLKEPSGKKSRGKKPIPRPQRMKLRYWGLGLCAGYTLLAVGLKWLATTGFDADLARRGTKYERRMESPTPFNLIFRRAVVDRGDELWVGYRTVFESRQAPVRWTIYPKGGEALSKVADLREARTLTSVTDGWWLARPNIKGAWLGDLRFPETRIWGSKKDAVDSRLAVSWLIDVKNETDRLREIRPGQKAPDEFSRRWKRMTGDRAAWEANPRLAGAAGNLPEFLPVAE